MKEAKSNKIFCYVDESGDTVFFNKKGKNLVESGDASPLFIVGHMELENPNLISKKLSSLREDIEKDEYLRDIPSVKKSINHFHAKDDCPEVREKIFRAIKNFDIKVFVVLVKKREDIYIEKFNGSASNMYAFLVEKLFENRLHLHSDIDIYFSKMGSVVREKNMKSALEKAKENFYRKWGKKNNSNIRIFIQEPSHILPLQVIDYLLWALQRALLKGDMRYYNYLKEKFSITYDVFDFNSSDIKKKLLDKNKISPLNS